MRIGVRQEVGTDQHPGDRSGRFMHGLDGARAAAREKGRGAAELSPYIHNVIAWGHADRLHKRELVEVRRMSDVIIRPASLPIVSTELQIGVEAAFAFAQNKRAASTRRGTRMTFACSVTGARGGG